MFEQRLIGAWTVIQVVVLIVSKGVFAKCLEDWIGIKRGLRKPNTLMSLRRLFQKSLHRVPRRVDLITTNVNHSPLCL